MEAEAELHGQPGEPLCRSDNLETEFLICGVCTIFRKLSVIAELLVHRKLDNWDVGKTHIFGL